METKEKSEIAEGERKANVKKKVRAGVLIFFAIGFLFLTCTVIWCMTSFPYVSIPEMLSTVKNLGGAPSINFLLFVLEAIIPTAPGMAVRKNSFTGSVVRKKFFSSRIEMIQNYGATP